MRIGDKFTLTDDAIDNYGNQFADKEFTVVHVARNIKEHPGYDTGVSPQYLYDAEELTFSVYDWEVIPS